MDTVTAALARALEEAIQAEYEGYTFYMMAARATDDAEGKATFERLARDEIEHASFLRAHHTSLTTTGTLDPSATLGEAPSEPYADAIFSPALRDRLGEAHFEMTALSVGIQLEQQAMAFYRAQAEQASDDRARAFFEELARWEQSHYDLLHGQQTALKEEYWSSNRFAPF